LDLHDGPADRGRLVLLGQILFLNPMAPYAVRLVIRFPCKSADLNATALYALFTVLAFAIAVPVLFENSVKKPPQRSSLGK